MSRIRSIRGEATLVSAGEKMSHEPPKQEIHGLGDVVALIADPIARKMGIDKAKCGCAKRKDWLNKVFPFR